MTRRILLALLALTATLLVAAVVPLAVKATQHDQQSFVSATEAAAHSLAAVADEHLGKNAHDPRFQAAVGTYASQGDEVVVANATGHFITGRGTPVVGWQRLAMQAVTELGTITEVT